VARPVRARAGLLLERRNASDVRVYTLSKHAADRLRAGSHRPEICIVTDGHAPGEYRADTVRNLDPWYAAFNVKPGQALYRAPAERVRIW
jgi:hypothetical protein